MKKLLYILSIFCLIALFSCNKEPDLIQDSISNSSTEQGTIEETNYSNSNTSQKEDEKESSNVTSESTEKNVLPGYDDGDTWGEPF